MSLTETATYVYLLMKILLKLSQFVIIFPKVCKMKASNGYCNCMLNYIKNESLSTSEHKTNQRDCSLESSVPSSKVPRRLLRANLWSFRPPTSPASRHKLNIPRFRSSTFGTQTFSVVAPTVRNSLPDSLRDPAVESERFMRDFTTYLFARH